MSDAAEAEKGFLYGLTAACAELTANANAKMRTKTRKQPSRTLAGFTTCPFSPKISRKIERIGHRMTTVLPRETPMPIAANSLLKKNYSMTASGFGAAEGRTLWTRVLDPASLGFNAPVAHPSA